MLTIQKLFIKYNLSTRKEKIKFICIHDVGAVSSAINNQKYFGGGNRGASADFFIDSKNIIQLMDYNTSYSWSVGDGKGKHGITNGNSLSIEMCLESNMEPSNDTVNNTLDLVKVLMKELNIPLANVIRHHDASGKICPRSFSKDNWQKWNEFKKALIPVVVKPTINPTKDVMYRVVTGSFSDRNNAENRIAELKKVGFDSFIALN